MVYVISEDCIPCDSCITETPFIKEWILCAAIWVDDKIVHDQQPENIETGFVICGRRHNNCYQTIKDLCGDVNEYFKSLNYSDEDYRKHQGFITSTDRFVSRKEGWKIARLNNQIQFGAQVSDNGLDSFLISENLY